MSNDALEPALNALNGHLMRPLLFSLFALAISVAGAQESPTEITEAQVDFYQLGIETGCKDAGRRKGDPVEKVEGFCSCMMRTLKAQLTSEEWRQAAFFSRNHQAREEMQIIGPHMTKIQECRNTAS